MRRDLKRISSLPGGAMIGIVVAIIAMATVVVWAVQGW